MHDAVVGEMAAQRHLGEVKRVAASALVTRVKPQRKRVVGGLDDLESMDVRRLLDDRRQRKRQQAHGRPSAACIVSTSSRRPSTRIAGIGLPQGQGVGRATTESPRS